MRFIQIIALGLAVVLAQPAHATDGGTPPTCRGSNMLVEMQGSDAHARILSAAAEVENTEALLWKIEHAGKPVSYLFGTVHLTDDRVVPQSPAWKAALAGSRRLVLELDDMSSANFMRAFVRQRDLMMLSGGRRLRELLDGADFAKAMDILQRGGLPAEMAETFRPWVASLMLALSDCERVRMRHGLLPLDMLLAREAQTLGLQVAGLETIERQLMAMASVPEADQVEVLKAALRTYDRIEDILETTVQLYLGRQVAVLWPLQLALAEKAGIGPGSFASLEKNMVVERNLGMRDSAVPHLADGGAFIAVGALHLPGRQGLVALLREAGYTVTAVE